MIVLGLAAPPLSWSLTIGVVAGCLAASGFFSGCETGLMSTSRIRLRSLLARRGDPRGPGLLRLLEGLEEPVLTCLVGTNLFNVLGSAVMTLALTARYGQRGELLTLIIMSVLSILFAEILPKILFREYPERLTLTAAPLIRGSMIASYPVLLLLRGYTLLWRHLLPAPGGEAPGVLTRRTLSALLLAYLPGGGEDRRFQASLQRFLDLADQDLRGLMRPFASWTTVPSTATVGGCLATARASGFSRLPVVDGDRLRGYVLVRDLLLLPPEIRPEMPLPLSVLRTCLLVDVGLSPHELFEELHAQRSQLAVVVDGEGLPLGLVTLEDLIESIVGSIQDEFDAAAAGTPLPHAGSRATALEEAEDP